MKQLVRQAWPLRYREAQRVAFCESRYGAHAVNGQYKGVFQLSARWRAFMRWEHPRWHDVAFTAWENVQAAHEIFMRSGKSWQQWSCGYVAMDRSAER